MLNFTDIMGFADSLVLIRQNKHLYTLAMFGSVIAVAF
jgi:hypothetical protein